MIMTGKKKEEVFGEKPVQVPLYSPQNPQGLAWDGSRASTISGWRLSVPAMAQSVPVLASVCPVTE
jgi:hypothetical protein